MATEEEEKIVGNMKPWGRSENMVPKSRNKGLQRCEGQEGGGCDMDQLETEGQECPQILLWGSRGHRVKHGLA